MNKFFVKPEQISGGNIYMRDRDDIRHMSKVLRMKAGDETEISDGCRYEYKAVIERIGDDEIRLCILDKQGFAKEPSHKITLYQGIAKHQKMETVIQKAVETGAVAIVPVFTSRTVVEEKAGFTKKTARWQKICAEAVKQCKRDVIPQVKEAIGFCRMEEELQQDRYDLIIFAYENEEKTTIKQALQDVKRDNKPHERIALIIGPEGGFSDEEAGRLTELGALSVSLGRITLRTETAGTVAISMIMYELEM